MATITISVPEEMKAQLDMMRINEIPLNVSEVCRGAIKKRTMQERLTKYKPLEGYTERGFGGLKVKIVGDSPLVHHKANIPKSRKGQCGFSGGLDLMFDIPRHPDGGYAIPPFVFKKSMARACRQVRGISMARMRGATHISGDLLKIEGQPTVKTVKVRVMDGATAERAYYEFEEWETQLSIIFNPKAISRGQLLNLLHIAGSAIGVGMGRQEIGGKYGTFHAVEIQKERHNEKSTENMAMETRI